MPDWSIEPSESVIICTRNRPDALEKTLQSVAAQTGAEERLVLVIDGSDPEEAKNTADVVYSWMDKRPFRYHRYQGAPAQTRQRNAGIDLLPPSVEIIHFIDDDVTLKSGYFDLLTETLRRHRSLLGVGGVIKEPSRPSSSPTWAHLLFLLNSRKPSQVLPSGHTSPPADQEGQELHHAEWLSTCSSTYRRSVFQHHKFDPRVEGPSPTLHDLDFSYRVAQDGPLAIVPSAYCIHRRSPRTRRNVREAARERVARRYWFIEKNSNSPIHYAAFWWSVIGQLLILLFSSNPNRDEALLGFTQGIRSIWNRDHPLLPPDSST